MNSSITRLEGYLKQLIGEVVGSQALHDEGKYESLGAPESEPASAAVYAQLLPEIGPGGGPYVKVSSEDTVVYVAISEGAPFDHARDVLIKMAENLTSKPEETRAPTEPEPRKVHQRPPRGSGRRSR